MVMATVAATQTTVRTRMPGKFGFSNTWLKLLSPADPSVMPSGVMFWNEVWIIVTMGHRTTTAIRAIAGPIQSSGSRAASRRRPADLEGLRVDRRVEVLVFGTSAEDPGSAAAISDIKVSSGQHLGGERYRGGPAEPGAVGPPRYSLSRRCWPSAGSRRGPAPGCR